MSFSWKRNLVVLWIGVFFCSAAYSISIPFLPIFLHTSLGVNEHLEAWSGISFGITFLASALISPYWGSLSDKYGRKPMLIRSGYSLAVLYFLNYLVTDPYSFLALRVLQGLLAGFVPASIALVATNTPDKHVGYALGIMATSGATGGIIGPLIGGFVSHLWGNREAFLFSAVVVLIAALIATFFVKETNFNRSGERSHVADDIRLAMANRSFVTILGLAMVVTISVMLLEPLLTVYVLQLGASQQDASLSSGIIFSAVGIATVLAAPQWGKIGNKIGYSKILFIGLLGGGIGNLLQYFFTSLYGFGILRFVYGLFFAAVYPSLNALIVKVTDPEFRGRAFSLNQSSTQLANMIGPVLGGFLGGWIPIRTVFIINGIALLVIAVLMKTKFAIQAPAKESRDVKADHSTA
ncbi:MULTISPECIES: MFS transporter [Brevibacillus]|uniref:MFS transporter n=1 Tax=Brevibacillus TaxID=55080 RepID=UPI00046A93D2|nr:MFS transporter [Brevibacillus borstelensis]MCC0564234.1 MFS transporter [Brevibacillus borstelensis]MCM3471549.1 MFS transporter [Brevibacillus borstelensis]MCM3559116.1 MFS transporter [Brevibacillus borstelensis]MCM3590629.1 MFS transporter [Brevibacillus borstelensis]MCM3622429.1 MFS transporter [Brevibacillus borstelensis]